MGERSYTYDEYREAFMPRKCKYCGGKGRVTDNPDNFFAPSRTCGPCDGTGLPGVDEMLEDFRRRPSWMGAALHRRGGTDAD